MLLYQEVAQMLLKQPKPIWFMVALTCAVLQRKKNAEKFSCFLQLGDGTRETKNAETIPLYIITNFA